MAIYEKLELSVVVVVVVGGTIANGHARRCQAGSPGANSGLARLALTVTTVDLSIARAQYTRRTSVEL